MMTERSLMVLVLVLAVVAAACSGGQEAPDVPPSPVTATPSTTESPAADEPAGWAVLIADAEQTVQIGGTLYGEDVDLEVEILSAEWLGQEIPSPFVPQPSTTHQGEFLGVRYTMTNNGATEMQSAGINGFLSATDGTRLWSVEQNASTDQAGTVDDDQPAAYAGPGFSTTSWAVFVVPSGADIIGLVYDSNDFGPIGVALPDIDGDRVDPDAEPLPDLVPAETQTDPATDIEAAPAAAGGDLAATVMLTDAEAGVRGEPAEPFDPDDCVGDPDTAVSDAVSSGSTQFMGDDGFVALSVYVREFADDADAVAWLDSLADGSMSCAGDPITPDDPESNTLTVSEMAGAPMFGDTTRVVRSEAEADFFGQVVSDLTLVRTGTVAIAVFSVTFGETGPSAPAGVPEGAIEAMVSRVR